MNEKETYNIIEKWLLKNKKIVIANVVETWGSSPRPVGSIMAINNNNEIIGSVSGGCVENFVFSKALNVIKSGEPITLDFGVTNSQAWEVGLTCGGKIKVFLEKINNSNLDYIKEINNVFKSGKSIVVVTRLRDGKKIIINNFNKNKEYKFKDEIDKVFQTGVSKLKLINDENWFFKIIKNEIKLLIVGAVHIANPLIKLAKVLGYEIFLIDPRDNYKETAYGKIKVIKDWPDEALKKIAIDSNTALVTLTHDPKLDDSALEYSLKSKAFYIGCLGSKKTHSSRLLRLAKKGFKQSDLSKLNGPIGLDIGARTPQEIAVSIISKIIEEKNNINA